MKSEASNIDNILLKIKGNLKLTLAEKLDKCLARWEEKGGKPSSYLSKELSIIDKEYLNENISKLEKRENREDFINSIINKAVDKITSSVIKDQVNSYFFLIRKGIENLDDLEIQVGTTGCFKVYPYFLRKEKQRHENRKKYVEKQTFKTKTPQEIIDQINQHIEQVETIFNKAAMLRKVGRRNYMMNPENHDKFKSKNEQTNQSSEH